MLASSKTDLMTVFTSRLQDSLLDNHIIYIYYVFIPMYRHLMTFDFNSELMRERTKR